MTTFVLVHGAACSSWHWHLLEPELRARGHDVVAVDLPCEDDAAGLAEYADAVVDAVAGRTGLVLVAHSFAGFTAPLVCARVPVERLVLLTAMVPLPGEAPGEWWAATGHDELKHDDGDMFFADLPPDLAAEAAKRWRDQSGTTFERPWPLGAWPDVPTRFLLCRDDRMFPAGFMRRMVRERLGIVPEEMGGGHFPMLSRPGELAGRLLER